MLWKCRAVGREVAVQFLVLLGVGLPPNRSFQELLIERGGQDLIFHTQRDWQVSRKVANPPVSSVTTKLVNVAIKCNCFPARILKLTVSLEQHIWLRVSKILYSFKTWILGTSCTTVLWLVLNLCTEYVNCFYSTTGLYGSLEQRLFASFLAGASSWIKWCRGNTVKYKNKKKWK